MTAGRPATRIDRRAHEIESLLRSIAALVRRGERLRRSRADVDELDRLDRELERLRWRLASAVQRSATAARQAAS